MDFFLKKWKINQFCFSPGASSDLSNPREQWPVVWDQHRGCYFTIVSLLKIHSFFPGKKTTGREMRRKVKELRGKGIHTSVLKMLSLPSNACLLISPLISIGDLLSNKCTPDCMQILLTQMWITFQINTVMYFFKGWRIVPRLQTSKNM